MSGNPYQTLGTTIPPMLGRQRLFEQLMRQLTKASPDHVSVVGPCHYGKSVILQHLANVVSPGHGEYLTCAYWDLRHNIPDSDETFLREFAAVLKGALKTAKVEVADYIGGTGTPLRDEVALVLSDLSSEKKRILLIMDGFDHVLGNTGISRNTWDTLRSFAQFTSIRFVTGSRKKLRELCKTEDSATSDLWEVFNPNPLRVGRFEDHDWDGLLQPVTARGIQVDGSAQKEIINWTGGIPVLATALMHLAYESVQNDSTLSKTQIDEFATTIADDRADLIADLWDDCSREIREELADLQVRRELPSSEVNEEHRREMDLRGLAKVVGTSLRTASTLVGTFARQQSSGLESLRRLFGDSDRFFRNARTMVELRLSHVRPADTILFNTVSEAIRQISNPPVCIGLARIIANRAFEVIWKKELPDGEISLSWAADLKDFAKDRRIPAGGRACRLLQLATGTDDLPRLTKHVSKRTYALLNFIQSVGDHGQHLKGDEATWSYATAFCLAAVELCDSLFRDFTQA
jgi:hypothetical protein